MSVRISIKPMLVLPLLAAAGLRCDFPPDPPLKDPSRIHKEVVLIDSARSLLPLRTGNIWLYMVVPTEGLPQPTMMASPVQTTYEGVIFYKLQYLYYSHLNEYKPISAFPDLLMAHKGGLSFYEAVSQHDTGGTRMPRLMYTLPYPARAGSRVIEPQSGYTVYVSAKDTLLRNPGNTAEYSCYRYDIMYRSRRHCTIYALPGSALIRIEHENFTFLTTEWKVE